MVLPRNSNKTVLFNIMSTVVLQGMAFFTTPLFSRLLGTDGYGLVSVYTTWVSLMAVLITFEPQATLIMAQKEYPEQEQKKYQSSILFLSACVFAVCCVLLLAFIDPICRMIQLPKAAVIMVLLQSFGTACVSFLSTRFSYEFHAERNAVIAIALAVANVALSVLLIYTLPGEDYMSRIYGIGSVYALAAGAICIYTWKRGKTFFNCGYWKFAAGLTVPMIFHGLSNLVMGHSDRLMLQWQVSNEAVGIYNLAFVFASVMISIWNALSNSWTPFFYADLRRGDYKTLNTRTTNYLELYTVLSVGFMLLSREVFRIFAPAEFWSGEDLIVVLTAANFFTFLYSLPLNYELYHKKTKAVASGTVITAVVNVGLNYVFIFYMGALGAAISTALATGLKFIFHYTYAKRIRADSKYPFSIRMFAPFMLAFAAAAAASVFLRGLWWLRWLLAFAAGGWELLQIVRRKVIF